MDEKGSAPLILAFCCHHCAYAAADAAGISRFRYPPQFIPIRVPCTGRLDPLLILEAFSQGADGVAILGCHEQDCHHRTGTKKAKARLDKLLPVFVKTGIDARRIFFGSVSASEGRQLVDLVNDFVNQVAELGPLGFPHNRLNDSALGSNIDALFHDISRPLCIFDHGPGSAFPHNNSGHF